MIAWNRGSPEWPAEQVAMLRKLHRDGLSFMQIGDCIGRSRNACIGKARRLKLPDRRAQPAATKLTKIVRKKREVAPMPVEQAPLKPALSHGKPITLANVASGQCRFPLWPHEGPLGIMQVCGHATAPEGSYCERHMAICCPQRLRARDAA